MNENEKNFDLPRSEGEDIFDYLDRFAAKIKSTDYGPDGNLARDMLVATTVGNYVEADRIGEILKRMNAAGMKIIK